MVCRCLFYPDSNGRREERVRKEAKRTRTDDARTTGSKANSYGPRRSQDHLHITINNILIITDGIFFLF